MAINDVIDFSREVTIHVCDETRDAKRDFTCRQGKISFTTFKSDRSKYVRVYKLSNITIKY
jgi:hypothetical protein